MNSKSTKSKAEELTTGLEKKTTTIKDSSRQVKEMGEAPFIGLMVVGIKEILRTESSVDKACCTGMADIRSIRETGKMACLMARAPSFLIMEKGIKDLLRRIGFMATASFIRMTPLFTASGKIISCQLLIWSNQF